MKLLLWTVIGVVVVLWLLRGKKTLKNTGKSFVSDGTEKMLQCAYCGTYVPASEAVTSASGAAFCNEQHRHAAS